MAAPATPTLEVEVEKYTSIVAVPPKTVLKLMSNSGGVNLRGNQFDTGILAKAGHLWSVIFGISQISVQMDLLQRDDCNRYTLKPIYLELISQKKVKSRHEMKFQSAACIGLNPTKLWHASWVNDGSWDDTIDSVGIVFQVCRESAGPGFDSFLWYEKKIQCKYALRAYTERDYKGFYLDPYFADATVLCKGETFSAHKMVLSNRSPVFKNKLSQDLETKETITMNEFEPEVIKVFLKFMYFGQLDITGEALYNSLFDLANIYQVDALRLVCELWLTERVTKENCIRYFKKSVKLDASLLKEKSWNIIKTNCNELIFQNRANYQIFANELPGPLSILINIVGLNL